ncbi:DUF4259 domain-containing protein [Streptomyces anulatus]|uniref:DUF4259 domain-containing protein n=1 Tax=Streptomyces TaxID=1883 RepID=UPI001B366A0D|nr:MULTISPECIES: DUF4259 domain-containing protein [unclassified Streptomyces]MBQ1104974.1 DUF4259 domain-containing protein [Streptomyces sp. 404i]MBQ1111252.1 DUF4259 domain-containing protein [Streptomyces sp. C3-3]
MWARGTSAPSTRTPPTLAVDALDQVVSDPSELAELWAEAANSSEWRQDITHLRNVLDPPIPPQEEAVFEI